MDRRTLARTGVDYVLNALAAHYLLGEALTSTRWMGIGLIVAGVFLVARSG